MSHHDYITLSKLNAKPEELLASALRFEIPKGFVSQHGSVSLDGVLALSFSRKMTAEEEKVAEANSKDDLVCSSFVSYVQNLMTFKYPVGFALAKALNAYANGQGFSATNIRIGNGKYVPSISQRLMIREKIICIHEGQSYSSFKENIKILKNRLKTYKDLKMSLCDDGESYRDQYIEITGSRLQTKAEVKSVRKSREFQVEWAQKIISGRSDFDKISKAFIARAKHGMNAEELADFFECYGLTRKQIIFRCKDGIEPINLFRY